MNIYDSLIIRFENSQVGINPHGGYVTSWNDILYVGSKIQRTGIPVLFPHFGKSEQFRMHGFGRDSLWSVTDQSEHRVVMELTTEMIDEKSRKEYPFIFGAEISVELLSENSLQYELSIINCGSDTMPILPGLHPYWSIEHTKKSELKIEGLPDFDATKIDWQNNPPDTIYPFTGEVTAYFPDKKIVIKDLYEKIKNIVVWSQTPVRDPDFNFVCIEPTCGDHFGIDRAPIFVEGGSTWEMKLLFEVH